MHTHTHINKFIVVWEFFAFVPGNRVRWKERRSANIESTEAKKRVNFHHGWWPCEVNEFWQRQIQPNGQWPKLNEAEFACKQNPKWIVWWSHRSMTMEMTLFFRNTVSHCQDTGKWSDGVICSFFYGMRIPSMISIGVQMSMSWIFIHFGTAAVPLNRPNLRAIL